MTLISLERISSEPTLIIRVTYMNWCGKTITRDVIRRRHLFTFMDNDGVILRNHDALEHFAKSGLSQYTINETRP